MHKDIYIHKRGRVGAIVALSLLHLPSLLDFELLDSSDYVPLVSLCW